MGENHDFSGYATKAGLRCSDGRTITADAFKHMDGVTVPLVWQHGHSDIGNVLGHAVLKARADGIYAYGFFNKTPQGKHAKEMVQHKDLNKLSIWANELVEKGKQVLHGKIKEVSLVLSGANPGAIIDFVALEHSDSGSFLDSVDQADEAIIHTGLEIELTIEAGEGTTEVVAHAGAEPSLQDVYDSLNDEQKNLVQYMIGEALAGDNSAGHSDTETGDAAAHEEGTDGNMTTRNTFETAGADGAGKAAQAERRTLSHSDMREILTDFQRQGSMKHAVEKFALAHGIDNIDVLFPEVQTVGDTPEFLSRRMEWVSGVLNATRHTPFTRIKTRYADITMEEARAKGYVKGTMKKEEFFNVAKRTTGPTTVYKKQKLDRDDILDITELDVVAWMKGEMRLMLDEELARAILLGDGRAVDDADKIKDPAGANDGNGIRSVLNDHELYATTIEVNIGDASSSPTEIIDLVLSSMGLYKGTGSPTFYTTLATLNSLLLAKDTLGRRLYATKADVAAAMGVGNIVTVEVMEDSVAYPDLLGIIVNLSDYNIGTDKGGDVSMFDFFDIDFNQMKYLIETRCSGALVKLKSALIVKKSGSSDVLVDPVTSPTFDAETGVVTIPTLTHVTYKDADTGSTLSAGAQTALDPSETMNVVAVAASGYFFAHSWFWSFTRNSE